MNIASFSQEDWWKFKSAKLDQWLSQKTIFEIYEWSNESGIALEPYFSVWHPALLSALDGVWYRVSTPKERLKVAEELGIDLEDPMPSDFSIHELAAEYF